METSSLNKYTLGFGTAAMLVILGNTVLTWVKEENEVVAIAMKSLLWHHWIAQGVFVIAAFLLLGWALSHIVKKMSGKTLAVLLVGSSILGALGLVALFLF